MKVYNFSSGPSMLPQEVLKEAQHELLDWHKSGMSVMEMSHRGSEFGEIIGKAEELLRELLDIPYNYKVLFLSGGASLQFSAIPLNLIGDHSCADYLNSGVWSQKAISEAEKYTKVNVVASSESSQFKHVAEQSTWKNSYDPAYLHITSNETIGGVEMFWTPQQIKVPIIADMSSNILSRPLNVNEYGLIYAGAQKNIGPSGLTIVIIHRDLLGKQHKNTPTLLNYQIHAENISLYNTPNTFAIYIAGLVFKWLLDYGGLLAIENNNIEKSQLLYDYIDNSSFYRNYVARENRSRMNVVFNLEDTALESSFLQGAEERGLYQLKGHRLVGGMRASIYNAMPREGVLALIEYMDDFANENS